MMTGLRSIWLNFRRFEHSQTGETGYSRVVYCNDPGNCEHLKLGYRSNYVSTTKYTKFNFIPKSLFEQFRSVANVYFFVVACVSFSPLAPYTASSILASLFLVIGVSMAKDAFEDWRRWKQDVEVNNQEVHTYDGNHNFQRTPWKKLRVGDLLKVCKDEYFPADVLLLASSYEKGVCYVETVNLDGESELKKKCALEATSSSLNDEDCSFQKFKAVLKCEDPNEDLGAFVGTLHYEGHLFPLSLQQLLLRDSKLRNTEYVYGVVIFTGYDTKVMQNATDPPSKRSKIERKMDKITYILFVLLVFVSLIGSFFFGINTARDIEGGKIKRWYLRPDHTVVFYDPKRPVLAALFHVLTGPMLYGYMVPISLNISIEVVKLLQSKFINQDLLMYGIETNKRTRARSSNLNDELGQVDFILCDKSGTLTQNAMDFVKCSIGGVAYGRGMTEVERAITERKGGIQYDSETVLSDTGRRNQIKGFNFNDKRIMDGKWVNEPHADMIQQFFRLLAVCHTVIPEVNEETGEVIFTADSPDEAAFVITARELGFELFERTQTSISLHELDHISGRKIDRSYTLLHVLEFTPARKRMSVVVRNAENQFLLLCKGADSVILERLSEDVQDFVAVTKDHISGYSEAGLRTLVIAYRELSETELRLWEKDFRMAQTSLSTDREAQIEEAANKIERNLVLLGVTAVEDKLQEGVPGCIEYLQSAEFKIWIITGDKMETAINIGYACSLLRGDMGQIVITLDSSEIKELEKQGDKEAIAKASKASIKNQITEGKLKASSYRERSVSFGLIIDGKSLVFALSKQLEYSFLDLAVSAASVICCRCTPKQKALVTRLVKNGTGKTTLAIGDGANDIGMLREADIGVGISGVEGMQAAMSSDFAIPEFRFLSRLLLVHGHWCYRRISLMIRYFVYKNILFGLTLVWFEAHASFSGQPAYNDYFLSFYNVLFTSLPVIAVGVYDQDVSSMYCMKFPRLYGEGVHDILFSWPRILGWILNGIVSSLIIFFFTVNSVRLQAFRPDGHVADLEVLGIMMYTSTVWVVNCQLALTVNFFTCIHQLFIWGSIASWYVFLLIYGAISPAVSTSAYRALVEACAPSLSYWLGTLLVVVSGLLPYMGFRGFQVMLSLLDDHDVLQDRQAIEKPTSHAGLLF